MTDLLFGYLRKVLNPNQLSEIPDRDLLVRFLDRNDQAAFELIVRRHGALVHSVCRRILHNPADVEDAFQSTFITLLRKADTIEKHMSLGSWLYKVSYRIALRQRGQKAKQAERHQEFLQQARQPEQIDSTAEVEWKEIRPILDEEISRLPRKFRDVIVLCYLEGKTNREAATVLGCPKGTVLSRLARARERLKASLTQRGLGISVESICERIAEHHTMISALSPVLISGTVYAVVMQRLLMLQNEQGPQAPEPQEPTSVQPSANGNGAGHRNGWVPTRATMAVGIIALSTLATTVLASVPVMFAGPSSQPKAETAIVLEPRISARFEPSSDPTGNDDTSSCEH